MKKTTRFIAILMALVLMAASQPASAASKTVKTQKELTDALASGKYTKLTIKEYEATSLKIPAGSYPKVTLYIKSPDLIVENSANFKQIVIQDVSTYTEKASDNNIKSVDKQLKLTVAKKASVKNLTFNKRAASVTVANEGTIAKLKFVSKTSADIIQNKTLKKLYTYQPCEINIVSGTVAAKTAVYIYDGAGGTKFNSNVPFKCALYDDAVITAEAGAEGSAVNIKDAGIGVVFNNSTAKKSTVTEADGSKKSVAAGKKYSTASAVTPSPTQAPTSTPTPTPEPTPTPVPTATPTPQPTATPTPVPLSFTVKQIATDEVQIEGTAVKEGLTASDISMYYMNGTVKVTAGVPRVNKINAGEDGKKNITFYSNFIAGKEYTLQIGDASASFTAVSDTLDDIVSMSLETTTVNIGETKKLDFRYYDVNGVDLTPRVSGYINFVTYKNDNPGYLSVVQQNMQSGVLSKAQLYSDGQICFFDEGTAQLVCTLVISRDNTTKTNREITISPLVVGALPEISKIYYTVAKDDGVYMTTSDEQKQTIEMGDTANCFELIIEYTDGTKKTLPELGAEYTVESQDVKKVTVSGGQSTSGGKVLVPTGIGSVNLVIKRKTAVIETCPIEVRAARKAYSMSVVPSKNYLNTNPSVGDSIELVATVVDQYGDVMENPGLTITQTSATAQTTGTAAFGAFVNGKLTINGSSVSIVGTGNQIAATITSTSNTAVTQTVAFYVKNIAYDATKLATYQRVVRVEGNTSVDTVLSVGTQKNDATDIYLEYQQEGFRVNTTAGSPLDIAPGTYTTASYLGVTAGTTGIYYTLSWNNAVMPISSFQADHVKLSAGKVSFIPFANQSKLRTGYYKVDFYQITAYETTSTVTSLGSATINVVETQPSFTYQMIGTEVSTGLIGSPASMATALLKMYWNGVQISSDCVQYLQYSTDAASQKNVLTGVSLKLSNSVYGEFTSIQNIGSEIFSFK